MEIIDNDHIDKAENGIVNYGEVSSGMESESENGQDVLGNQDDNDAAIRAMEVVLQKARQEKLKQKYLVITQIDLNMSLRGRNTMNEMLDELLDGMLDAFDHPLKNIGKL